MTANAQWDSTEPKIQTLFGETHSVGWWVAPGFEYAQLDGKDAWLGGMSGGVIFNHNVSLGVGGYGIMNSNHLEYDNILDTASVYLYGGYGGLIIEYRLFPFNKFNIAFPIMIGGGSVSYSSWNYNNYQYSYHDPNYKNDYYIWDAFFVFEPGISLGVNLLNFMRLDAGISYRFAPSVQLPQTDPYLLNSVNANMSLKFGKF